MVKKIVKQSLDAQQLASAMYGKVTSIHPLEVLVDQRFSIPSEFLILPEHLTEYKVELGQQTLLIRKGLEVGDKLILIRSDGGLQYVVVGRLNL
ncbi:hypothetical protein PA598K_04194 [Paenibacillus sp. 598K]|nr:hypothetical protein PA598K_04194 [Paenibacillus sp. 598K]